jgi:hypothetical protein
MDMLTAMWRSWWMLYALVAAVLCGLAWLNVRAYK